MIKKRAALFFILISNIILLGAAAIPHHHHHSQICFQATHCKNDKSEPDNENNSHNHEHDGKTGIDLCLLKQAVVLPSSQARQELRFPDFPDSHSFFYTINSFDIKACDPVISVPLSPLIGFYDRIPSSYSCCVSSSLGLRAPPSV